MNKEILIKLTSDLYRLTLLFPKKEPLRYKLRELSDEIFEDIVSHKFSLSKHKQDDLAEKIDVLDGFFEIAKSQNWVNPQDIEKVKGDYLSLISDIKKPKTIDIDEIIELPAVNTPFSLLPRQQKILDILKQRGSAQVWQIKQIFPDVSKRTLRRDFEHLLGWGIIERMGERNDTFYRLKG